MLSAAGEDFVDEPSNLTLSAAQNTSCFNVSIINDNLHEDIEEFFVNLTSMQSIVLIPSFVRIQILDQDSEWGKLHFL